MSDPLLMDPLVRAHAAGTTLFREGDAGRSMFVIREGKVRIWKRISNNEVTLALLGSGEFFGEMALLEGLPRSANATVAEDARLIEIEQEAFETLVRSRSDIAVRLLRRLSSRLREADRQIQALMSRSTAARALSFVRALAEPPDAQGTRLLPSDLTAEVLAERVGLASEEAGKLRDLFGRSGLVVEAGEGRLALGPDSLIDDFLLYVELQEQYDPLDVRELADLAGLPEQEAHRIVRKVLSARLEEARRGEGLVDAYGTYLALKQRFEYAD